MTREDSIAAWIQYETGVHVEWAPANREYVVDYTPISGSAAAKRLAYQIAAERKQRLLSYDD